MPSSVAQSIRCTMANNDSYLKIGAHDGNAVWASLAPLSKQRGIIISRFPAFYCVASTPDLHVFTLVCIPSVKSWVNGILLRTVAIGRCLNYVGFVSSVPDERGTRTAERFLTQQTFQSKTPRPKSPFDTISFASINQHFTALLQGRVHLPPHINLNFVRKAKD